MRVLLTSNAAYVPPRGGSTRSNLVWLEAMAAVGQTCQIVCAAPERDTPERGAQLSRELQQQQLPLEPERIESGVEIRHHGDIPVLAVEDPARRATVLADAIQRFTPDWVLVSSEDLSHSLLREAERAAPDRVVYLAHTPQFFPFGPESWNRDSRATAVIVRCAAVIAISQHVAAYVERHTGRSATVLHPPMYGSPPFPSYGDFDRGMITMINPCAVKGISIFIDLARAFPEHAFGALPGWGTTQVDLAELAKLPNVTVLSSVRKIEEVLARTRILLMPSLWFEGFGLIAMEAMLRGVPVIASDTGGLVEAKRGTGFVVPVKPVERYEAVFDERNMPKLVIPSQNIEPWRAALTLLLSDRSAYEEERERSQGAAIEFVSSIKPNNLGEYLSSLDHPSARPAPDTQESSFARLSPEKRALLLHRLKKVRPTANSK